MAWWNLGDRKNSLPVKPAACQWAVLQGELNGQPAFVRLNESLAPHAPIPGFDHEVLVIIHFSQPGEDGMPQSAEDLAAADDVEDAVKNQLEADGTAILSLAVTKGGARALHFYSSAPKTAIQLWEQHLQPEIRSLQVEFRIRPDKEWQAYKSFA